MPGQVDHERETREGVLVDASHTIVYEETWQEDGKWENAHIMIAILVKGAQTLSVHDQHLDWIAFRRETLDWLAPDPDSLLDKKIMFSGFFASFDWLYY